MGRYWVNAIAVREDEINMLVEADSEEEAREKAKQWDYKDIEELNVFGDHLDLKIKNISKAVKEEQATIGGEQEG